MKKLIVTVLAAGLAGGPAFAGTLETQRSDAGVRTFGDMAVKGSASGAAGAVNLNGPASGRKIAQTTGESKWGKTMKLGSKVGAMASYGEPGKGTIGGNGAKIAGAALVGLGAAAAVTAAPAAITLGALGTACGVVAHLGDTTPGKIASKALVGAGVIATGAAVVVGAPVAATAIGVGTLVVGGGMLYNYMTGN